MLAADIFLMRGFRRRLRWFGAICGALASAHVGAAPGLKVGGTGAASPILEKLLDGYRRADPDGHVELVNPPLGSSAGIRAVSAGRLDLAISGRQLKPDDAKKLRARELARSPIAFVVNGPVGRENLTRRELADIYSGSMTRWNDGTPLRLVLRPASDSDSDALKGISPEMGRAVSAALARSGMAVATQDMENAEMLSKARGVFGGITLCQLRAQGLALHPLALDGVVPSLKTMSSGEYPIYKSFIVVTRSEPSAAVERFVKFLFSAKARRILLGNDCQPISGTE